MGATQRKEPDVNMIPLEAALETHPGKALRLWRASGQHWPGLKAALDLWRAASVLRDAA